MTTPNGDLPMTCPADPRCGDVMRRLLAAIPRGWMPDTDAALMDAIQGVCVAIDAYPNDDQKADYWVRYAAYRLSAVESDLDAIDAREAGDLTAT